MTFYRTCTGCLSQGKPCDTRNALRKRLAGIGVTSVKWKCADRKPVYQVGSPVWVDTVADNDDADYRDEFPGIVIDVGGTRPLVFIDPGSLGRNEREFVPNNGRGFCRIPFSRLTAREGELEKICPSCNWPDWKGHQEGYLCAMQAQANEIKF